MVDFPTPAQAKYQPPYPYTNYYSFLRKSRTEYWKLWGFAFLKINNNARCSDPLGPSDYPSGDFTGQFSISFTGLPANSRVYYEFGSKDPTLASQYRPIDGNGEGTLTIEEPCAVSLRAYAPEDGYLASKAVRRIYQNHPKKTQDDGSVTAVSMVVTHVVNDDTFYCEQWESRAFGIRVQKSVHGLGLGDWLDVVSGTMDTTTGTGQESHSERYIEATSIAQAANRRAKVEPLCMCNKYLGGGDWHYDDQTGEGQRGVNNGAGLNNIGLLVRTTGCVCESGTSTFSITDGSGAPVKVVVPSGVTAPGEQTYVGVTGISSCEVDGEDLVPVLLVRDQDDITDYAEYEACGGESRGDAPIRQWPAPPPYEGTDTVAWAVGQSDGTAVAVVGAYVTRWAVDGLSVSDIQPRSSAAMTVLGNWAVPPWSTVDVAGTMTTLAHGTRAVIPSQLLVYTDASGRPMLFGVAPRGPAGQVMPEWPYKRQAIGRSI